ncbi:MAG: glycosyltransferase family 9 protein [Candidatus Kryptoniota bacterium]
MIKLIKQREPQSEIHFVVKDSFEDLIKYNPLVTAIYTISSGANIHELERLRKHLVKENFDETIDLQNNFRSIYLRRGTSAKIKTIKKDILKRLLLVKFKINRYKQIRPVALKYAQTYDRTIKDVPPPELFFNDDISKRVLEIVKKIPGEKPFVALCPGSKHFTKQWPAIYWVELAKAIMGETSPFLIGGPEDSPICTEIASKLNILNFCGRLSILESSALLGYAKVVVTGDSYLMHAANALGKKIVAFFGSTVKEFGFAPYLVESRILEVDGLTCRPCSHIGLDKCPKGHFKCMTEITPAIASKVVRELLY